MALTATQRPPGRDQSRSQQIRHTHSSFHTLCLPPSGRTTPCLCMYWGWDHFHISQTSKADFLILLEGVNSYYTLTDVIYCEAMRHKFPLLLAKCFKGKVIALGDFGKGAYRNSPTDINRWHKCTWLRDLKDTSSSYLLQVGIRAQYTVDYET